MMSHPLAGHCGNLYPFWVFFQILNYIISYEMSFQLSTLFIYLQSIIWCIDLFTNIELLRYIFNLHIYRTAINFNTSVYPIFCNSEISIPHQLAPRYSEGSTLNSSF